MMNRLFRIFGLQPIAIGGLDMQRLKTLWVDLLGVPVTGNFLLPPMLGPLVQVAPSVSQKVQAGERLVVIEAMKMENVLVAPQDVVVAEVLAKPGESLSVDQPILRFAR